MTPLSGRLPRDAGVVVGLFPGGTLRALPPLSLTRRRSTVPVRVETIAPGLHRVLADTRRIGGRYTLSGVAGDPELLYARARIPPPPARPAIDRVERYIATSGTESRTEVKVHYSFPIPAGVVAVVAAFGDSDSPTIFARGVPQQNNTVIWSGAEGCTELPAGSQAPPQEGTIRVAFVDLHGQMSPLSVPHAL